MCSISVMNEHCKIPRKRERKNCVVLDKVESKYQTIRIRINGIKRTRLRFVRI